MTKTKINQDKNPGYWLASSNLAYYNSLEGFKKYSEIDWGNRGNNKIEVGDIVYIYLTKPEQKIAIKTVVTKSGYGPDELLEDESQINRDEDEEICEHFIRLKLVHFIDSEFLGIDELRKHGVNGNLQGKRRIPKQTLSYIQYHEKSDNPNVVSMEELDKELENNILFSKHSSAADREKRLEKANKHPVEIQVISRGFKRNADVIVAVLERANGVCERCNFTAPFIRKKDGTPYLEVHHKIQLANGGEDSIENAIAVCPNCHREMHFGV
jgi:5-methylcytosine-specific restriction protein A